MCCLIQATSRHAFIVAAPSPFYRRDHRGSERLVTCSVNSRGDSKVRGTHATVHAPNHYTLWTHSTDVDTEASDVATQCKATAELGGGLQHPEAYALLSEMLPSLSYLPSRSHLLTLLFSLYSVGCLPTLHLYLCDSQHAHRHELKVRAVQFYSNLKPKMVILTQTHMRLVTHTSQGCGLPSGTNKKVQNNSSPLAKVLPPTPSLTRWSEKGPPTICTCEVSVPQAGRPFHTDACVAGYRCWVLLSFFAHLCFRVLCALLMTKYVNP